MKSSEPKAAVPRRPFRKRHPDGRLADLLPLLTEIDRLRDQLHEATMALFNTVNANRPLFERYHRFLNAGGSTAEDLKRYLASKPFGRGAQTISRGHNLIRLVAATKHPRLTADFDDDWPDEAA
jgi:hypothetical protein